MSARFCPNGIALDAHVLRVAAKVGHGLMPSIDSAGVRPGGNNMGLQPALRQTADHLNAFIPAGGKKLSLRLSALFLGLTDVGFDVDVFLFHDVGSFP